MCRGSEEKHFKTLHKDGETVKPFSWVVGADGVAMLLDPKTPVVERLRKLGFADYWIRKRLQDGEAFR